MKALNWLRMVHNFPKAGFFSIDMPGKVASNSELARWIKQGMLHIDGKPAAVDTWFDMDEVQSIILFPKNKKRRATLI